MSPPVPAELAELIEPAEGTLGQFLQSESLKPEQWFMRLSVSGIPGPWKILTADSSDNDRLIKEQIAQSEKPVTELALAFAGMVEWRGSKRMMVYLQFYLAGRDLGVLCLRHLKEGPRPGTLEAFGGLFLAGTCKNIWL